MITGAQAAAAIKVLSAVYEAIAATGDAGIPGGTLYAHLMAQGCTLENYTAIVGTLTRSGLVTKRGEILVASPLPARTSRVG